MRYFGMVLSSVCDDCMISDDGGVVNAECILHAVTPSLSNILTGAETRDILFPYSIIFDHNGEIIIVLEIAPRGQVYK